MASLMRVPRTRGAFSGLLLVLLGAWGALIPFIGPYFNFAFTPRPNDTWYYTSDRLWLSVLPGAAAFLGGLIVMASANRATAIMGGWLAAAAGAWFVVGPNLSPLSGSMPDPGTAAGGTTRSTLEVLFFFFALGVVIVFLAALALGRFAVVGVRETRQAEARAAEEDLAARDAITADRTATAEPAMPAAPPTGTGRETDAWTEPPAGTGRHESMPAPQPRQGTAPAAKEPMPPMAPPTEGEKVGAGAGVGHDHHRRLFHRRHHDDES